MPSPGPKDCPRGAQNGPWGQEMHPATEPPSKSPNPKPPESGALPCCLGRNERKAPIHANSGSNPTDSWASPFSHSSSFDQRRRPETLRTAMATAFFWPTSTTSPLPRVTPV